MIYLTVEEIPEDRYIEIVLAGDEDEDLEQFDYNDEELEDDKDDDLPVDIIHIQ